ncbi:hypothetical protein Micbo1qcDRAFT_179524 [Microdochium bolleyi]|uniref:Uncharacterized protein n=1 Tax=Microdochium bolleyi TaxID=196109 RepID=A0A136IPP2_9PEZI|nr:hypothetical protein Micbo1qcDRAFT_179524 [Microdochium bolleyi]
MTLPSTIIFPRRLFSVIVQEQTRHSIQPSQDMRFPVGLQPEGRVSFVADFISSATTAAAAAVTQPQTMGPTATVAVTELALWDNSTTANAAAAPTPSCVPAHAFDLSCEPEAGGYIAILLLGAMLAFMIGLVIVDAGVKLGWIEPKPELEDVRYDGGPNPVREQAAADAEKLKKMAEEAVEQPPQIAPPVLSSL